MRVTIRVAAAAAAAVRLALWVMGWCACLFAQAPLSCGSAHQVADNNIALCVATAKRHSWGGGDGSPTQKAAHPIHNSTHSHVAHARCSTTRHARGRQRRRRLRRASRLPSRARQTSRLFGTAGSAKPHASTHTRFTKVRTTTEVVLIPTESYMLIQYLRIYMCI